MSTIIASNVSDGTLSIPTAYVTNGSAKAWVNYNSSMTIYDSLNISSLADNGTGLATISYSNDFANSFYSVPTGASDGAATATTFNLDPNALDTGQVQLRGKANGAGTVNLTDLSTNLAAWLGDLA